MFRKLKRHIEQQQYDHFNGPIVRSAAPLNDGRAIISLNPEVLAEQDRDEFFAWAAKRSGHKFFNGQVEHGYSAEAVGRTDICPRCGAPTERQYAHFIYATQIAPRVMFAAAGHFCSQCPTVIVEEDMIEAGIADPYCHYQGVLGLDVDEQYGQPCAFRTWNGRDAIFITDEDDTFIGLETGPSPADRALARQRKLQKKTHRKIARHSRKINRRTTRH